ncbi:hypothetical protein SAMN05518672_104139 [Chitinophaga sp. CF118]|uniref:hypothetical protein n=1 Tax=Chitinophaga sp. CF118 TaxID=1884367 RepID=UPI0008E3E12F|nr:hypothetical protein [Chitinophaga sp. CF118]SFE01280.1 hypothetical protein SAMN05518672_104139 [Chitinophaga sp. CF118]
MFEQFMQLIQESGQQSVVNNPEVPNEHNEGVMKEAGSTIMSALSNLTQTGQVNEVLATPGHPAVQEIQGNFATNIIEKFGINKDVAGNIASTLIPSILASVSGKTGGLDLQSILQSFGGSGNLQSTLSGIGTKFGLDKDGDGDVDLNDVTKMFKF